MWREKLDLMLDTQRKADWKARREHEIEINLLERKALSLQIAMGELGRAAGFADPYDHQLVHNGCLKCLLTSSEHECSVPILDALVKCWELLLSYGVERWVRIGVTKYVPTKNNNNSTPFKWFLEMNLLIAALFKTEEVDTIYSHLLCGFPMLVDLLGFDFEQLVQAYFEKHGVHESNNVRK